MDREYYHNLRNQYKPINMKSIFILESPPASGKYFYDVTGSIGEPLFKAIMKLFKYKPVSKEEGLFLFQNGGCFLVDATYKPVNKLKGKNRNKEILADYENLVEDLRSICKNSKPDIILIKANICRLLASKLVSDGFRVKNKDVIIPFPSSGQQTNFEREMAKLFFN